MADDEVDVEFTWVARRSLPIVLIHTGGMALLLWLLNSWVPVDPLWVFFGGWLAGVSSVTDSLRRCMHEFFS